MEKTNIPSLSYNAMFKAVFSNNKRILSKLIEAILSYCKIEINVQDKELEIRNKPLVLFGSCGWRDTKFIDKWENDMEDYGFNVLGKLAVKDSIEKDDLIKAKELGKLLTLDR